MSAFANGITPRMGRHLCLQKEKIVT
ncbi:hypothetical protein AVEN_87958-1, partial [Araneus ventricosus]